MKSVLRIFLFISLLSLLTACGGSAPTEAAQLTSTPDPCSQENLPAEVDKVNKLTREFDDYAALASNTPQSQLVEVIPDLQRVLRDAEDQKVPACLADLKNLQISHMTIVVQTLMAFMGNSDVELVNTGIAEARGLHAQYDIELARLLGIPLTTPTP